MGPQPTLRSLLYFLNWNTDVSLGTPILRYRFAYMSTLEIAIHVEALVVAAFGILVSLGGIASLWAFRKIGRLAS